MLLIRTHLGSITDSAVGAHAVVNASNPELALGSGVSGAIRTACGGAAFQKEGGRPRHAMVSLRDAVKLHTKLRYLKLCAGS